MYHHPTTQRFTGTLKNLKEIVSAMPEKGHWTDEDKYPRYVINGKTRMTWYSRPNGTISFQGMPDEVNKFILEFNKQSSIHGKKQVNTLDFLLELF